MADADPAAETKAAFLASWMRLGDALIETCYITVHQPGAPDWATIVGTPGADLKQRACDAAETGGFLDNLARAVANWEIKSGRPVEEIAAMLDRVGRYGVMQGMTDQQKGFMNADILLPMLQAREACAIVKREKPTWKQLGTAFLVGPDLVLTAAHVVSAASGPGQKGQWLKQLKEGLVFEFRARPNQPDQNRVPIRAADKDPLVAWASPHGPADGKLDLSLDPPADSQLDYALVRLAQRVEHVQPVALVDDATVIEGKVCWAFGFPPGNMLMMDVDLVTEIADKAGRWVHKANTEGGMSGGCCLNHEGQIAGIHEGTVHPADAKPADRRNRGVSIAAIRKAQLKDGKDPLRAAPRTEGVEFQDPALVEGLYRAGLRLGGEAMASQWRAQVQQALKIDPEGAPAWPLYHPWFKRKELEDWVGKAAQGEKLCLVYGESGVGKSFCARIIREKLDPLAPDLLMLNPTQLTSMNWADAMSSVLAASDPAHRTAAAAVRYNDIGAVIDELTRRSAGETRPCYVVMDFGPEGDAGRFVGTQWIELVAALAALSWTQLCLIDLNEAERIALISQIQNQPATATAEFQELELQPISRNDFLAHGRKLVLARGSQMTEAELRAEVNALLPAELADNAAFAKIQTVLTALAGIVLEGKLK